MKFQCSNIWPLHHWVPLKFLWSTFTMLTWWNQDQKNSKNDKFTALLDVTLSMSHLSSQATHTSTLTECIQLPANEPISPLLCHSLPTATEDHRDLILLITSPVVNSGGRTRSIQLTAWQLFWLSSVTLAKTYFCQFTKKISLGEGIHMLTFLNWLLKNVLRIFGKMPVLKTELKFSTENKLSAYNIQVLQVNLCMMLLRKCLQDQKEDI